MVKNILSHAGFVENETFKECRFVNPPPSTFVTYLDSILARGGDYINLIKEHRYTVELYSPRPDREAEKRIENALNNYGLEYEKQDRYWIQEEQLYQVIYDFDYIEKIKEEKSNV